MSDIKKSERKESKLEVIHNAYKIRTAVTKLAENNFYINENKVEKIVNEKFAKYPEEELKKIKERTYQYFNRQVYRVTNRILDCACEISQHLRRANTIFPTYMSEFEERRLEMDRAMEACNALQDELQYAGECLYADLNKYTSLVLEIQKEFNMIKSLRQSDNRFLKNIKSEQ